MEKRKMWEKDFEKKRKKKKQGDVEK